MLQRCPSCVHETGRRLGSGGPPPSIFNPTNNFGSLVARMLVFAGGLQHAYSMRQAQPALDSNRTEQSGGLIAVRPAAMTRLFAEGVDWLFQKETKTACNDCVCSFQHMSTAWCQEWLTCKCTGCKATVDLFTRCVGCVQLESAPMLLPVQPVYEMATASSSGGPGVLVAAAAPAAVLPECSRLEGRTGGGAFCATHTNATICGRSYFARPGGDGMVRICSWNETRGECIGSSSGPLRCLHREYAETPPPRPAPPRRLWECELPRPGDPGYKPL